MKLSIRHTSLIALGAVALSASATSSANATMFFLEGTTGYNHASCSAHNPYIPYYELEPCYPEYQGATFKGFFEVNPVPLNDLQTIYKITNFELTFTNPLSATVYNNTVYPGVYPEPNPSEAADGQFGAIVDDNNGQAYARLIKGSTELDFGDITSVPPDPIPAARVTNNSLYNPTRMNLKFLFKAEGTSDDIEVDGSKVPDPSTLVTYNHEGFASYIVPFMSQGSPARPPANPDYLFIPITSAKITPASTAAVPEPTTIAGMAIFGAGVLLKKRGRKAQ